jgi:hypothetical protein
LLALPAGLGSLLIFFALSRARDLLSGGRPAEARVTEVHRQTHSHGSSHRVELEFTVLSGAKHHGRLEQGSKPPAVGSTLIIVYDPDQPKRQARYPMKLVRVAKP